MVNLEVLIVSRLVKGKFVPCVGDDANHESSEINSCLSSFSLAGIWLAKDKLASIFHLIIFINAAKRDKVVEKKELTGINCKQYIL